MTNKTRQNPRGKWFQQLTPEMAWEQYVTTSVEVFISNFHADGYTDIGQMCKKYASEIPALTNQLFTHNQLGYIADLLDQYAQKYIEKKGGIDNLDLYSREEVDAMLDDMLMDALNVLKKFSHKGLP